MFTTFFDKKYIVENSNIMTIKNIFFLFEYVLIMQFIPVMAYWYKTL